MTTTSWANVLAAMNARAPVIRPAMNLRVCIVVSLDLTSGLVVEVGGGDISPRAER